MVVFRLPDTRSLDTLERMFDVLVEEVDALDDGELTSRLCDLERRRRALDAEIAAVVNSAERRGVYRADGHRSVRGWVVALTNCSDAHASRVRSLGRLQYELPVAGEALLSGAIGPDQAQLLARVRHNPRCGDQLADVIELLLGQAAELPFVHFRLCARRWESLADANGAHRAREHHQACRTASVFADADGLDLRASGGNSLDAAEMVEIFEKFREAEFLTDWDRAVAEHGDRANASHLARTDPQRRHDALLAIFRAAVGAAVAQRVSEPTVNIVVDEHTFVAHLAGLLDPDAAPAGHTPDPTTIRCETSNGVLLHPDDVVRAALIGRVRRVVFDQAGTVIDFGRRQRLFTGSAREAVLLHATRCVWPGCTVTAGRCEIDHLNPWGNSGPTSPSNGGPVCQSHNRWKNRGYTIRRDSHGSWHTYRPDGTELTQPPLVGAAVHNRPQPVCRP